MTKVKKKRHNIYLEDELWKFASINPHHLSAAAYIRKLLMEERDMQASITGYYARGETVYRVVEIPGGIRGEIFSKKQREWVPINPIEAQFYGRQILESQARKIIERQLTYSK